MMRTPRTLRRPPAPGGTASNPRSGMTLIEVLMALIVLLVAIGGMLGSISSFVVLGDAAREKSLAVLEAQRLLEEIRSEEFDQVLALYNSSAADDPPAVPIPGDTFAVPGLNVQEGDPDGFVGRIIFPTNVATPTELHEDIVDPDFGFPRDLNGDGVIDAADHADDYAVLPVRIRVEWRGRSGNCSVELQTILRNT